MSEIVFVRKVVFKLGEAERQKWCIETNRWLRGELPLPQPCTCATDHGWHYHDL